MSKHKFAEDYLSRFSNENHEYYKIAADGEINPVSLLPDSAPFRFDSAEIVREWTVQNISNKGSLSLCWFSRLIRLRFDDDVTRDIVERGVVIVNTYGQWLASASEFAKNIECRYRNFESRLYIRQCFANETDSLLRELYNRVPAFDDVKLAPFVH